MNCSTGRSSIASPRQRSSSRHGDATTIPSGRTHRSATSRRHRRQSSGPDNHPDRHPHLPRRWPRCPSCTKIETGPPYGVRPLGDGVILSAPVRKISKRDSGVEVVADNHVVQCQKVIVAIPPVLAAEIQYEPQLPTARAQLFQRFPMGSLMKIEAVYDEPFW